MKKVFKILGITVLLIVIFLLAAPFLFQSQIKTMVKQFINENVNAEVAFTDVDLSFMKSFPLAKVSIDDLVITNFAPFENDTLVSAKTIAFDMSIKELFKKSDEDPIEVKGIAIDNASIAIKVNKEGVANYDIAKADTTQTASTSTDSSGFAFSIDNYEITQSNLSYTDETSEMSFSLTDFNHSGSGDFTEELMELDTKTDGRVSFTFGDTNYFKNQNISLDAIIDINNATSTYTFKENKGVINKLPIAFNGFVKLLEDATELDVTFENPGSSFKDFLAVIPETYAKNIEAVETTGNFKVKGAIKGKVTETTIPTFNINIASNNASFKYPDLPKGVDNIVVDALIKNTTGNLDDTAVDLKTLNFKIDNDEFKSSATLKNVTKNMLVDAHIDGVLNLENITKAYPVELDYPLKGILKGNINTNFDMNAIETNAYSRIKNNGDMQIDNFEFSSTDIVNPIKISHANVVFNPETVTMDSFNATTGKSDMQATGTITNLLGFLLSDSKLKGDFNVNSNTFYVSDFMVEGGADAPVNQSAEPQTALKIPAFLDCDIKADAKTVYYDNLTLKDVKGNLEIKNEQAQLKDVTSSMFNGQITVNGLVNTKEKTPTFNLKMDVDKFDISESFNQLKLFQSLVPIANALQGKLNTVMSFSGTLGDDFTPVLSNVSGDAFAELLTTEIEPKNEALFSSLKGALSFIDFEKLNINDIKTKLEFKNGNVNVKPFNIKYQDINITVSGSHGFNSNLSYNAVFDVPAKYLGNDVNALIQKIGTSSASNLTIPVTATIGGSLTKPTVKTDLSSGITNLTKQLVEIEKQKLLNQGKDKLTGLLGGVLGGSSTTTKDSTSTQTNTVKDEVKNVLGGILGGNNTTKTDTTSTTKTDVVKDVLGGLFGKKKN